MQQPSESRAQHFVEGTALVGVAVLLRCWRWAVVFTPEGVRFFGNDAWYHARRVLYAFERGLEVPRADPYVAFPFALPQGGEAIWPPLVDGLLALVARAFVDAGDVAALERFLAWVAPIVGATTALVVARLGRRLFGPQVGRLAGWLLATSPAHARYTQLGFVDHHAFGVLVSCVLAWTAWRIFSGNGLERTARSARAPIAVGLMLAVALAVWPGALWQVACVELGLLAWTLNAVSGDVARGRARAGLVVQCVAAFAVAPFGVGGDWQHWGRWSPLVLTAFQPFVFAGSALVFATLSLQRASALDRARRGALALCVAAAVALAALGAIPDLARGLADAWAWLARSESFQALVAESAPLFFPYDGAFDVRRAAEWLGLAVFATPVLVLAALRTTAGADDRVARIVMALWLLASFVAALAQQRFAPELAAPLALAVAWASSAFCHRLACRTPRARAATATALLLVASLIPSLLVHVRHAKQGLASAVGPGASGADAEHLALVRAGEWLRANTPATRGYFDVEELPEYGVLAAWEDGHILRYAARRPMVVDNFGDDVGPAGMEHAEAYFASDDEETALALLAALRVRYVVVRGGGAGQKRDYAPGAMARRLYWEDMGASYSRRSSGPLPALSRHRLIQSSEEVWQDGEFARPFVRVFERVEGALLVGESEPGAEVTAWIAVREPSGHRFRFRADGRADAGGRYAWRVPYPSGVVGDAVQTGAHYVLRSGGREVTLRVGEADVRSGRTLDVPSLRSAPAD